MPVPFYQCLIIMVFDAAHKVYVPVAWILMSGKTEECYWQAFNWLTSAIKDIDASYIGVDFERAFFAQLGTHFSDAKLMSGNTPTIRVQSIGLGRLSHSGEPETIQSIK